MGPNNGSAPIVQLSSSVSQDSVNEPRVSQLSLCEPHKQMPVVPYNVAIFDHAIEWISIESNRISSCICKRRTCDQ